MRGQTMGGALAGGGSTGATVTRGGLMADRNS
jgi:hypothetical protein